MSDSILTPDQILEAAVEVMRRYGPDKATVVDVARVLDVSHGSIYRHFASKAALRDAVMERWLAEVSDPLVAIVNEDGPALPRLRRWLDRLIAVKRSRVFDDPELFAMYMELAAESREVIQAHISHLVDQLTEIIADGVARGEFTVADPVVTARAVFDATTYFHKPAHVSHWSDPGIDAAFEGVWSLVVGGLGRGQGIDGRKI